ncbi:hypothetical protein MNBD_PLANCTO02-2243 [hydrothermal vent metagenome]|uniref:Uncharacterized protein n=1 Tax=hydrothermal vent metagenome TaxID=652676 RepID=A0A3B1DN45_9ZZZZ
MGNALLGIGRCLHQDVSTKMSRWNWHNIWLVVSIGVGKLLAPLPPNRACGSPVSSFTSKRIDKQHDGLRPEKITQQLQRRNSSNVDDRFHDTGIILLTWKSFAQLPCRFRQQVVRLTDADSSLMPGTRQSKQTAPRRGKGGIPFAHNPTANNTTKTHKLEILKSLMHNGRLARQRSRAMWNSFYHAVILFQVTISQPNSIA